MLNVQQKVRQRKDKLQTCHPQLTSVLHYVGVNAAVGARPNPSDHSTVHHHYHHNCHNHFSCRQTGGTLFTYFFNSFFLQFSHGSICQPFIIHSIQISPRNVGSEEKKRDRFPAHGRGCSHSTAMTQSKEKV